MEEIKPYIDTEKKCLEANCPDPKVAEKYADKLMDLYFELKNI